ncbi:MAG: hypothetical protein IJ545_00505 [Alphaproteobacteria bacterium]|nr:hypothetical protein [Alphaproteobacteria bacterium]
MDIEKIKILSGLVREHKLTGDDLNEMTHYLKTYHCVPVIQDGAELPIKLKYTDNSVSDRFVHFKPIKALHIDDIDISLSEASVPMNYENALTYCRQLGGRMMTAKQALQIYEQLRNINEVLEMLGFEKIREYQYWIEDRASKSHLRKTIDFRTGEIKEVRKYDSFRVRPMRII